MCGRPSTTIGFERRFNPLLRLGRPEFISTLAGGVPARPLNMVAIEATNRGREDAAWAMLTSLPAVEETGIEALDGLRVDAVLLDVREPEEYAYGHVPGAINLPQAELATRLAEVPRDRPVFVICESGMRSLRSSQFLRQMGYDHVTNVRGGTAAWRKSGQRVDMAERREKPRVVESEWTHAGGTTAPAGG